MIFLIRIEGQLVLEVVEFMDDQYPRPNSSDEVMLASARRQINIAFIFSIVSLIIGGMLLSSIGLILAILALRKLNLLQQKKSLLAQDAKLLLKSAKTAIVFCIVAISLNLISFIVVYPQLMEMIDSGQFDYLLGASEVVSGSESGASTWG